MTSFAIIERDHEVRVDATIASGRVYISTESLKESLGWELRPEGLCRGDMCVPVEKDAELIHNSEIDLAACAKLLRLSIASDTDEKAAFVGAGALERSAARSSLEAPNFTLPDLNGRPHTLSSYRNNKVILIVYASW